MNKKSIHLSCDKDNKHIIIPIFIPFLGCPSICVYCNQKLQTSTHENSQSSQNDSLSNILEACYTKLKTLNKNKKYELAFYGGTFTALSDNDFALCMDFVYRCFAENLIHACRCSTRPDCLDDNRLHTLYENNIHTIELGIQSFSEESLTASRRNYSREVAISACKKVKSFGFNLGIQLMPNLPKQVASEFLDDVVQSIELKADFMRIYPCLVVEGTRLERMWQKNEHTVWEVEQTIDIIAKSVYLTWQAHIPVIRIGVHYEEDFYAKVLAGVSEPNFGQIVQEKAALIAIDNCIKEQSAPLSSSTQWHFPLRAKGYLAFKKNRQFFDERNISSKNITWHDGTEILIR